jgi:hypothetical protein
MIDHVALILQRDVQDYDKYHPNNIVHIQKKDN